MFRRNWRSLNMRWVKWVYLFTVQATSSSVDKKWVPCPWQNERHPHLVIWHSFHNIVLAALRWPRLPNITYLRTYLNTGKYFSRCLKLDDIFTSDIMIMITSLISVRKSILINARDHKRNSHFIIISCFLLSL